MKKIWVLIAISTFAFCHSHNEQEVNQDSHDHVTVTQFCESFHQRSYFILRIEQIIAGIKRHNTKPYKFIFNLPQYKNDRVIACINEIKKTNSINPFFTMWDETRRYKYLDDETFALDFTKLLFTIQHTIYTHSKPKRDVAPFDIELHLSCTNYTEATTIRKYHAKRLSDIFNVLKKINCSQRSLFEAEHEGCDCSFITHHNFTSKAIRQCILRMEKTKSIKPLVALYREFVRFKLIQDDLFLREFTALTFIVAQNIFINNIDDNATTVQKSRRNKITHINENLDKIPIEEVLEAIDLINQELPSILDKYELNSDLTWRAWFKKYWWLPPTVAFVAAIKILEISAEQRDASIYGQVLRAILEQRGGPPAPPPRTGAPMFATPTPPRRGSPRDPTRTQTGGA